MTDDLRTKIDKIIVDTVLAPGPDTDITEEDRANVNRAVQQILEALDESNYRKSDTILQAQDGETSQNFQDRAKSEVVDSDEDD